MHANTFSFSPTGTRTRPSLVFLFLVFIAVAGVLPDARAQPWYADDVGSVGYHGSSNESNGVIGVRGSGADIWGAADGFFFRHQPKTGDGAFAVRIVSPNPSGGDAWAKVGLMMRQDLAREAKNVMVLATPGGHIGLQFRAATGGSTTWVDGGWTSFPVWVLLDRVGDSYRAYRSYNGENWTLIGTATVALGATFEAGLAVTSHNNSTQIEATFDNLMDLGGAAPAAPGNLRITASSPTSLALAWDDNSHSETGFEIERAIANAATFTRIATVAANTTSYVDTGLTENSIHTYRVRATGASGASAYSNTNTYTTPRDTSGTMPAPTNFTVTFAAATSLQLVWTDNAADETGYELGRRVQNTIDYALVATLPANTTSYNDTGVSPNTAYDYRLRAVRNGSYSNYAMTGAGTTPANAGNWAGGDIGAVGTPGTTDDANGGSTKILHAGGGDIWGNADAFRIMYRQWHGDGSITARVVSLENTDPWAKAGVMIRATFDSTSPNASMVLTAGNVCGFQARSAAGAATEFTAGPRRNPASWVRLTRVGNVFTGHVSPDGTTWTLVGTKTIAMGTDVFIGLVASAHSNSGAQTTAVFDNISLPDDPAPPPPPGGWGLAKYGGSAGNLTQSGGDTKITAASGDIWGGSDSGLFALRELVGDVTIMARVSQYSPVHAWSKFGLMMRPTAGDARGVNAFVALTGSNGHVFQTRTLAGEPTTSQGNGQPGLVQWLKLTRRGNTFSGYYSTDNRVTWTLIGTQSFTMRAEMHVGLAVSSHDPAQSASATFSDVIIE